MDMDALVSITDTIDTYMYTYFLVFLLIGAGLYFTIRTKGVQFTHLKDMFTSITEKKHVEGLFKRKLGELVKNATVKIASSKEKSHLGKKTTQTK